MHWQLFGTALAVLTVFPRNVQAQGVPDRIAPAAVRHTKSATVYLKVVSANGDVAEGSGFLAIEPGIVVTNAHVVGMLQTTSKPPKQIDVVIRSGEADELALAGKVLGVDRANDLAVLKVEGKLPAPLQLGLKDDLFETQKVYIFGFPFGAKLGKDITVSESSISSLRKDASGSLERVQVNGGMHPGNSGGPVVNALGQVVGVSVAGIRSTEINFAIPARAVHSLLQGGIQDVKADELFRDKDEVRVPLQYQTLDPFGRIKEIRVETWTGASSTKRPFSTEKPLIQSGDGPRRSQTLALKDALAKGDVVLPMPAPGKVAWVQPVLHYAKGEKVWGKPVAFDPALALERIPVEIAVKLADQKERTVHLKTSQIVTLSRGKLRHTISDAAELDILETFFPDAKGARIVTGFGPPTLTYEENGKKSLLHPEVGRLLKVVAPSFIIDETNKLRSRTDTNLNPRLALFLREQVGDFLAQIANGYEAATFVLPNRKLEPHAVWHVQVPLLLKFATKIEVIELVLDCTYEGVRTKLDRRHAVVSFRGNVEGRGDRKGKVAGDISGKFTFDLNKAFIASLQMTISSDLNAGGSDLEGHFAYTIDLSRIEGNPQRIELPKHTSTPPLPSGDILLSKNGVLSLRDPVDRILRASGSRMQTIPIALESRKKYTIVLNSGAFDAYLRLLDSTGRVVAQDDDGGGGLNSRIDHVAANTGIYNIVVTSFNGATGPYQLQVIGERSSGTAKAGLGKDDPKTRFEVPVKGFNRPAKAAAPTSYLKVDSSPGDYIGQGKTYEYKGGELVLKKTARGVNIRVDGWNLSIGAPNGQFLQPGEYLGAKRFAFSNDSPGIDFMGKGRGSNRIAGEFVVWELEIDAGEITRLAIDFVQRSEEKGPPLRGSLRLNSSFE